MFLTLETLNFIFIKLRNIDLLILIKLRNIDMLIRNKLRNFDLLILIYIIN